MSSVFSRCLILVAVTAVVPARAGQAPPALGELAPALLPAVVNIYSMKIIADQDATSMQLADAPARRKQSLGSGFIIDSAGFIVTNEHIIEHAYDISVTLQDNTALKA